MEMPVNGKIKGPSETFWSKFVPGKQTWAQSRPIALSTS